MKRKADHTGPRQHAPLKMPSPAAGVHNSRNFAQNARIEWLQQLYAAWLEKRKAIINTNNSKFTNPKVDRLGETDLESEFLIGR